MGRSWNLLGRSLAVFGLLGAILGGPKVAFGRILGFTWVAIGSAWAIRAGLGSVLGLSWVSLGGSWVLLGRSWRALVTSWVAFGTSRVDLWEFLLVFGGDLWLEHLGNAKKKTNPQGTHRFRSCF